MDNNEIKTVGIITWNGSSNYGTNLQAYALYTKIKKLGYKPYMVSYVNLNELSLLGFLKKAIRKISKILTSLQKNNAEGSDIIKMDRVNDFVDNNFDYTPRVVSKKQYNVLIDNIDYFVTGSDQIWNPHHLENSFYFLDFVPNNKPKISYASSIGVSEIPKNLQSIYSKYLKRFDFLSLREAQGVNIIKKVTGRNDVVHVLDPTFLLDKQDWESFATTAIIDNSTLLRTPYIYCYFVGDRPDYWDKVSEIQKQTGINNIIITPLEKSHYNPNAEIIETAGPNEFIWLIQHASLVCTDSFHATALSINMQKDFIEFLRFKNSDTESQNSRIIELLEHYKLSHRLYNNSENISPISYDQPLQILEVDRLDSLNYLKKALGQGGEF